MQASARNLKTCDYSDWTNWNLLSGGETSESACQHIGLDAHGKIGRIENFNNTPSTEEKLSSLKTYDSLPSPVLPVGGVKNLGVS